MGCKRWWRGGLELLLLCILHHTTLGDGNIGCLYSKDLCEKGYEFCYNDLAFGKCIPLYDDLDEEDDYQYDLKPCEVRLLQAHLNILEFKGYKWSHPYTQCVMQTLLLNIRHSLQNNVENCNYLAQENQRFSQTNEIEDEEDDLESQESQPMAIVRFTPSKVNPHGEYADEIYYPPGSDSNFDLYPDDRRKRSYPVNFPDYDRSNSYDEGVLNLYPEEDDDISDRKLYSTPMESVYSINDQDNGLLQDYAEALDRFLAKGNEKNKYDYEEDEEENNDEIDDDTVNDNLKNWPDKVLETVENQKFSDTENNDDVNEEEDYEQTFSRKYKYPRFEFPLSDESIQSQFDLPVDANHEILEHQIDSDKEGVNNNSTDQEAEGKNIDFLVKSLKDAMPHWKQLYTEGGVVQSNGDDEDDDDDAELEDLEEYNNESNNKDENEDYLEEDKEMSEDFKDLLRRELAGFKRRERLDVKKPGPLFLTNNYGFKTESPTGVIKTESNEEKELQQMNNDVIYSPMLKKEESSSGNLKQKSHDNIDFDHVYVEIKDEFTSWLQAKHVVEEISKLLGLEDNAFQNVRIGNAEVTFKVGKNSKNYNATDIVNKIDDIRPELQRSMNIEIMRAGIGDKGKLPAAYEFMSNLEMSKNTFSAVVVAGVASAFVAAVVVLLLIRRHAKSRAKLAGLSTDPEASKDYQELCRARMQVKQPAEKFDSPRTVRAINRVNESNNSSSNRSSTSSWGEEPAPTNLDISTGHMVLSYMEDHLKNQDKLDEEWVAVCAYEAEPCSTAIAEKPENSQYNRPGAVLPYDHSRVVLNDLTSVSNSDYINASTITDHDPRNPAYIATQGPLPQTAAHFWQLVWEQGSVVILMLTRLTEDGKAMCHRYWPEEGSELYHIYEVHLVSEHIWCDDYLVRSFYLKNLRTGDTRTVTQFHFLSWPENGIPQSTKALLEFRRKVNKSYRGRSCPIVVHCSDGAGRTGTYCLIDMVLNRMTKGAKEIDIAATLEHIRDQRPGIVANKRQFEFVLMAVAEEVHAILKALPIPSAEKSPTPAVNDSASTSKMVCFESQQPTSKSN